jgi:hypothetical protein
MLSPQQLRRIYGAPDLRGAVILTPGKEVNRQLVRNQATGRVLPCCYSDCQIDGDNRYRVEVPHDNPRFDGERLVYIFCTELHKGFWLQGMAKS